MGADEGDLQGKPSTARITRRRHAAAGPCDREFPDAPPPKRFEAGGRPKSVSIFRPPLKGRGVCVFRLGVEPVASRGFRFYAPPVQSRSRVYAAADYSLPNEGMVLTGLKYSGRLSESAGQAQDHSEAFADPSASITRGARFDQTSVTHRLRDGTGWSLGPQRVGAPRAFASVTR
jgi:hypothetical protein